MRQFLERLIESPEICFLGVAALFLLIFLIALGRYRARHRAIVPFESPEGRIEISPRTVRELIERTAEQIRSVDKVRCSVRQRRGLKIHLNLVARAPFRLQELDAEVKRRVRATLKSQLGLENIETIDIRVTEVLGDALLEVSDMDPAFESHASPRQTPFLDTPEGDPQPRTPEDR